MRPPTNTACMRTCVYMYRQTYAATHHSHPMIIRCYTNYGRNVTFGACCCICCSRKAIKERKADIGDEAAAAAAAAAAGITCVRVCVCVWVCVCVSAGVAALTSNIEVDVAAVVDCGSVAFTPDNIVGAVVVFVVAFAAGDIDDTVNCHGLPGDNLSELEEFDEDVELPEMGPI